MQRTAISAGLLAVAAAVALAASGCDATAHRRALAENHAPSTPGVGQLSSTDPTAAGASTSTDPTAAGASTSTDPTAAGASTSAVTPANTLLATPPAGTPIVHLANFRSPSGLIGCVISPSAARCDIHYHVWAPPPRSGSCSETGQGLIVGAGTKGRFVCSRQTVLDPNVKALPFGTDVESGGFTCRGMPAGIACTSAASGHGFFISVAHFRTY